MNIEPHHTGLCVTTPRSTRVDIPDHADPRALHVTLKWVELGGLGWHRAGYVTLQDGITPVSGYLLSWHLTLCEATGLVIREPWEHGDQLILLSAARLALLAQLDAELFGAAGLVEPSGGES